MFIFAKCFVLPKTYFKHTFEYMCIRIIWLILTKCNIYIIFFPLWYQISIYEAVSYTHLDVYKRQTQYLTVNLLFYYFHWNNSDFYTKEFREIDRFINRYTERQKGNGLDVK